MKGDKGRTVRERFYEFVNPEPNTGCWLWDGNWTCKGYGKFGYKGGNNLAHRASYEIHVKEIPEGLWILHSCDVPCCVNPEHLFLGTQQDNVDDMERKGRGRHPRGEAHGRAKLTENQVRDIRTDVRSQRFLAELYGVSPLIISLTRRRKIWKHVI